MGPVRRSFESTVGEVCHRCSSVSPAKHITVPSAATAMRSWLGESLPARFVTELRGEVAKMWTMGASQRTVWETGVAVVVPAPEVSSLNSLISRLGEEASLVESDT